MGRKALSEHRMNPSLDPERLSDLDSPLRERVRAAVAAYQQRFGVAPELVVCAPGRVNLIGEHTDYNGFPVLPAAIDREIVVAAKLQHEARIDAVSSAESSPARCSLVEPLQPDPPGSWSNYLKAAVQVLLHYVPEPRGACLLVDASLPAGAGLSSSSALVVGTGVALLALHEQFPPRNELAEQFAAAERFVGTLSGGMDQAISLLAEPGTALRIDFFPLRTRVVPFPSGYRIAVCHSLVRAEKSGHARTAYNRRVWECTLGCRTLAMVLGKGRRLPLTRLADACRYEPSWPLSRFVDALAEVVPSRPVSARELAHSLNVSLDELLPPGPPVVPPEEPLPILARVRHVFEEAERVDQAVEALVRGDVEALGRLMEASHASCRDYYEVSCEALEELVACARSAGAIGPRLTGAGFGGATVQLIPEAAVDAFFATLDATFYRKRLPPGADAGPYRFGFVPSSGVRVVAV